MKMCDQFGKKLNPDFIKDKDISSNNPMITL